MEFGFLNQDWKEEMELIYSYILIRQIHRQSTTRLIF